MIQLIMKCIDSNQLTLCSRLTALLQEESIVSFLSKCKPEVEVALRSMEDIKMLHETVLDCSNVRYDINNSYHSALMMAFTFQ